MFPGVARQVLRGDVKQSELIALLNVHVPSLFAGKMDFEDKVVQGYDDKEITTDKVPREVLAVARCVVKFTDQYESTPKFDLAPHIKDGFLVSSNNQLRWKEGKNSQDGFFTMDTAGTKAVVGFANDQKCELGTVSITPQCRYAAIYVTAREKDKDLKSAKSLILVAIARARNTGMQLDSEKSMMLNKGKGPVLLEPVKATIRITDRTVKEVKLLDHDGRETGKTVPVIDGAFTIDGAKDKTPYYEVVMQ